MRLTAFPARIWNSQDARSTLAWSSESQQLAFIFNEVPGDKSNLYVINRDGSGLTKLTNEKDLKASTPVWQPQ